MDNFGKVADGILADLLDFADLNDADGDIIEGILYITTADGQYVINKHEPTKSLWIVSPISGTKHIKIENSDELVDLVKKEIKA
jgi:frataxin